MAKRMDILNAFYACLPLIIGDNYVALKSLGNGAGAVLDTVEDTAVNFKIGKEDPSSNSMQSLYFITAPVEVTAYKRYSVPVDPMDKDPLKETLKSDMIEQITTAFGGCPMPPALVTAGVTGINYTDELEPDSVGGDMVTAKLELTINWRRGRK